MCWCCSLRLIEQVHAHGGYGPPNHVVSEAQTLCHPVEGGAASGARANALWGPLRPAGLAARSR